MNLVKENPRNLHGIPEDDRTYDMCKVAFDNTYGKDKTDYSVAGALIEPSMALQMVREQDDPGMIDFLMDVMPCKAVSEEVALEAARKNGHILRFVPKEVITQRVGEAAVKNQPQSIRWVPYGIRTADMCLYAFRSDSKLDVYTTGRIWCEENVYTFARKWMSCFASRSLMMTASGSTGAKRSVCETWKPIPKYSRIARFATTVRMNR